MIVDAQRQRVLVVEDNADSADTLAALLEIVGFNVTIARDGLQALELVDRLRPDVVILDIGLPKVNGYDVCRCIRDAAWGENEALVAISGFGQTRDIAASISVGFDAYLTKPAQSDDILSAIEQALAKSRIRRGVRDF